MHPHRDNPIRCEICFSRVYRGHYRNVDNEGLYCEGDWIVCNTCLPTAMLGDGMLRDCLKDAVVGIHRVLKLKINKLRGVRYMTRKELWSIRRRKTIVEGLRNSYNLGMASSNAVIVLRPGISQNLALVTMAHEIAHIWQFEYWPCFALMEKWQVEGFAEWVAYKVAEDMGLQSDAEQMLQNADAIYGGGLRSVLEIEKKKGIEALLKADF